LTINRRQIVCAAAILIAASSVAIAVADPQSDVIWLAAFVVFLAASVCAGQRTIGVLQRELDAHRLSKAGLWPTPRRKER
jgi:hypothetical protein